MAKERDFFQRFVDEHPRYEPFRDDPLIRWRVISEVPPVKKIKDFVREFLDDATEKPYKLDALTDIVDLDDAISIGDQRLITHFRSQTDRRKTESKDYADSYQKLTEWRDQIESGLLQHGLEPDLAKTDISMDFHFLLRCLYISGKPYNSFEQFVATLPPELTGLKSTSQN